MAVLQSLLKIAAEVTGGDAVQKLASKLGDLNKAGKEATKGFGGLAKAASMDGLAGAFSKLMPLLSVGGIIAMTKSTIDAGDAFNDMSQRTGVSVEMLAKFKKAAALSGTSIEVVEKGLLRLSRNMAAAASNARVGEMTKADMDKAVAAVRDGERLQVEGVQRAADRRVEALQQESSRRMAELNRRYRNEQRLLDDRFDDQRNAIDKRIQQEADIEIKGIQRSFDERRKAIQRNESLSDQARDAQLNALQDAEESQIKQVRDGAERQTRERGRALRDQQQQQQDAIDDRKAREERALTETTKRQTEAVRESAKLNTEAIKTAADAQEKLIKGTNTSELSQQLEELGLSSKEAAQTFLQLGINVKNSDGTLRDSGAVMLELADKFSKMQDGSEKAALAQKLFGRAGSELIPTLNMGSKAIKDISVSMTTAFAKAADQYSDDLQRLSGQVGKLSVDLAKALLPVLIEVTHAVIAAVSAFNSMPGWLKAITVGVIGLGLALPTVVGLLSNMLTIMKALKTAQAAGLFVSMRAAVVAALAGIQTAITGLISWITAVAIPGLIAFFASPLGIALLVVAVIAAIVIFRKQIGEFLAWFGEGIYQAMHAASMFVQMMFINPWIERFNALKIALGLVLELIVKDMQNKVKLINVFVIQPIIKLWNTVTDSIRNGMKAAADFIYGIWTNIVKSVTGAVQAVVNAIRSLLRPVVNSVNNAIRGFNNLSAKAGGPQVGTIPAFAEGGVVDRPTIALVGERGREYVIPEAKAAAFSANYLAGRRGDSALNIGSPQINITTGPVLQQQDGSRYVSVDDLERAMRVTAEGVLGRLRTPSARIALGLR